jgi:hypothetical protein
MKKSLVVIFATITSTIFPLAIGPQSVNEYSEIFLRTGIPHQDPPMSMPMPGHWQTEDTGNCAYQASTNLSGDYSHVFQPYIIDYGDLKN